MNKLTLDYLTPSTARRFDFYLIPKLLIDHEAFDGIDYGSKLLYSLMLSRASLSAINAKDFSDERGRIYIIYTVEQVIDDLRCSRPTAVKMLKQLDDIGLIEKMRQGQGKPSLIYVKDFSSVNFQKSNILTSGSSNNELLESKENELLEVKKIDSIYNNFSYNNSNHNDHSQSHSQTTLSKKEKNDRHDVDTEIGESEYIIYERLIKNNIGFNQLLEEQIRPGVKKYNKEELQELVNCMVDVICSKGEYVQIGGELKPREMIKSTYCKLNAEHIEHVFDQFNKQGEKITHISSYLKTMLYNTYSEFGHYYTNAVRADGAVSTI